MSKMKKESTGYYIPKALAANKSMSWNEKAVYTVYHYFTFNGRAKVCTISTKGMSERLGIPESTMKSIRRSLIKKGYISTNGGVKTTALVRFYDVSDEVTDIQDESIESIPQGDKNSTPRGMESNSQEDKNHTPKGAESDPIIKNEIKKNKDKNRGYNIDSDCLLDDTPSDEVEKAKRKKEAIERVNSTFFNCMGAHPKSALTDNDIYEILVQLSDKALSSTDRHERIRNFNEILSSEGYPEISFQLS